MIIKTDEKTIKLTKRTIVQGGGEYLYWINIDNNKCIRIPQELSDLIIRIIDHNIGLGRIAELVETTDDYDYVMKNIDYMIHEGYICYASDFNKKKNLEIKIGWDLTNNCNLRCIHCCLDAGSGYEDIDTEEMKYIAREIAHVNPSEIVVSGGEPLMRLDFEDIIIELRKNYSGKIALLTNGTLINEEKANFICENFHNVSISLDGYDEMSCSAIRGKNVFSRTIKGINLLKNAGVTRISASMVETKITEGKRNEFKKLCESLGVRPIIRILSLTGRAKTIEESIIPDSIKRANTKNDDDLLLSIKEKKKHMDFFRCGAAVRQFQIGFDGNIYPCQAMMKQEYIIGNIKKISDLNTYLRGEKYKESAGYTQFEKILPYNRSKCRECNIVLFCQNGCLALKDDLPLDDDKLCCNMKNAFCANNM